jgi:hypothetical protein
MKRSGFIKRKPPKTPVERIPMAILRPGQMKKEQPAVKVMRDGREICQQLTKAGRDEYRSRTRKMWDRQGCRCGLQISPQCKERNGRWPFDEIQFDHSWGRGMAGGKRNDAILDPDGKPLNMAVCSWCNSLKSSRPLSDFDVFIP